MSNDKAGIFLQDWIYITRNDAERWAPQPEYKFHGTRRWRFDWAFPEQMVAVEVDGGQWTAHGGRHMTDKDRDKGNHAAALGWRVLHFSPEQLERDPAGCVELVQQALDLAPDQVYNLQPMSSTRVTFKIRQVRKAEL